jgi:HSP20 family protein
MFDTPFGLLRRLTTDIERLFGDVSFARPLAPGSQLLGEGSWIPNVDVFEKDGTLMIRADLPGLSKADVNVEVTDDAIVLKGERKKEVEEEREGVYRLERAYGSFCRTFAMPDGVKPEDVKATFANGVLQVTAPLPARKEPMSRKIEIHDVPIETKAKPAA